MKDKDLARLANAVTIRNHIFSLINGPTGVGLTNHDKETSRAMRAVVSKLDKDFVSDVLKILTPPKPKAEKKEEPKEEPKAEAKRVIKKAAKKPAKKSAKKKPAKASTQDPDVEKRLAEAKAALVASNG